MNGVSEWAVLAVGHMFAVNIVGIGSRLLELKPPITTANLTMVGWVYQPQMD